LIEGHSGIGTFALEALNAYEVVHNEHCNYWICKLCDRPRNRICLSLCIVVVGILMVAVTAVIFITHFREIPSEWSCLGQFGPGTSNTWLPILLVNLCCALAATVLSYESIFVLLYLPQYKEKMDQSLAKAVGVEKNVIYKCRRDLAFTAVGPWLLTGVWLTTAISSDWVTDSSANILSLIMSSSYSICNILQSLFTTPHLYSTMTWVAMRLLPKNISPTFDAETMWSRGEVLQLGSTDRRLGLLASLRRFLKIPSKPEYIPIAKRNQLVSSWTRGYAEKRLNDSTMLITEVIYSVSAYKHAAHIMRSARFNENTRSLFVKWAIRIIRRDVEVRQKRQSLHGEELVRLLWDLHNARKTLKILNLPEPWRPLEQSDGANEGLEEYIKLCGYNLDPFQRCYIVQVDHTGNTKRFSFLRTPMDMHILENLSKGKETSGSSENGKEVQPEQR
ncbi:hypothetical protein OESDEN_03375, partial [Oesophagostomum dentatum]